MIQNKLKIFLTLAKEGKVSDIIRAFVRYILLFQKYRFVELNLDAFHSKPYKARIPLDYRLATFEDMADIFHNWPDSQEEYERHHEVYYKWGFQTCFLFFHKETDEIVHLQFLLTTDDILNIKRFLPLQIYGCLTSNQRAFVEWMYTFEKHRLRGIAIEAMEQVLMFCKKKGIEKIYSKMGELNKNTIMLCKRIGFRHTATFTQIRFPWREKHSGIYLKKIIE